MSQTGSGDRAYQLQAKPRLDSAFDLGFMWFPDDAERILIDLSEVTWISPVAVVGLLARCLGTPAMRERPIVPTVQLPDDPRCRTYLDRIGFFDALGLGEDHEPLDLDQNYQVRACLPVTRISTEIEMERAANSLQDALLAGDAPSHLTNPAYDVLAELTNNAREHGSTCYVVAQTHSGVTSGTPGVHIAVADFGSGFKSSLAAYKPQSEAEAIVRAFDEGVTGTGDRTRGLGLGSVRDYVDAYDATLDVVSRDALVRRSKGEFTRFKGGDCGGVFVSAYFPFPASTV